MSKASRTEHIVGGTKPVSGASRHLYTLLRPYVVRVMLMVGMLFLLALVNMTIPASIGILFNEIFPKGDMSPLWILLPCLLLVYMVRNTLFLGTKYTAIQIGEQVCFRLRRQLFSRIETQDLEYFREHNPGSLSSRVMDDTFSVQTFVQEDLPKLLQAACLFVALIVVLYAINWRLALVTTIVLPVHLLVFQLFKRPIKQTSRVSQGHLASLHGNLVEKFLGMEVVQGFGAERREHEAFVDAIDESRSSQLATKRLLVKQKIAADLLIGVSTVALLGFGGYEVMKRTASAMRPGTFIAFFGYVSMLYPTVAILMGTLGKLVRAGASVDRIQEVLDSGTTKSSFAESFRGVLRGRTGFFWVGVSGGQGPPVLTDVNLEIPAGSFCVITGPSGSGKTTLVRLVPRLLEPSWGRILLDDTDLSTVDVQWLRTAIGSAFQECFLFNSSILENLRYANPEASTQQIETATRITEIHERIRQMPDGYDTVLGEGGWNPSYGERQRLGLARAMVMDPRVLIIDEATAALDVASEERIVEGVRHFMQGRTTLMVTQRTWLLPLADMLIVLDQGRVVYQGKPADMPPNGR